MIKVIENLTKRELFAAMAMQGILSSPLAQEPLAGSWKSIKRHYAEIAVEHADALLAALEEGK